MSFLGKAKVFINGVELEGVAINDIDFNHSLMAINESDNTFRDLSKACGTATIKMDFITSLWIRYFLDGNRPPRGMRKFT